MVLLKSSLILILVQFSIVISDAAKSYGEYGEFFQGDILITKEQLRDVSISLRNGHSENKYRWPNKTIPYEFTSKHLKSQQNLIHLAMKVLEYVSCVKFVERTNEKGYVKFVNGTGCYSAVGYQASKQLLSLGGEHCLYFGNIVHELMHALGFFHMQNSHDRDDHVDIHWDNIEKKYRTQFDKMQTNNFGLEYDYLSIMHYDHDAFSMNGDRTITAKDPHYSDSIGQRHGLSVADVIKINRMYDCPNEINFKKNSFYLSFPRFFHDE